MADGRYLASLGAWASTDAGRDRIGWMVWGICAFALWLNANPYIGIDHDARLYSLMAYRWLSPAAFIRDPWFAFGSQDDFSLFSPLLAGIFSVFGVAEGAMLATLIQGLGFAAACIALARAGLGRKGYPLAALLMVSFPVLYSPNSMLYVTEGFVTARGFSIPLSLAGLACGIRGKAVWSALLLCAAFLLHPIMAAAPLAVGILVLAPSRLRPWLLVGGWVGYVLLLLAASHGMLPLVEGEWRAFLEPAPLIFIDRWIADDLALLGFWGALLWMAARHGAPRLRSIYYLILPVAASGIVFSLLANVVPWTTALQAQFWRGIWLMKLMALCALGDLLWQFVLRPEGASRRMMSMGAALILLLGLFQPLLAVLVLVAIFCLPRPDLIEHWLAQHPVIFRTVIVLVLMLAIPGVMFELAGRVRSVQVQGFGPEVLQGLWRNAGLGLFALGLFWLGKRMSRRGFLFVVLALMVVCAALWDSRSGNQTLQEENYSADGRYSPFAVWIPRGATVSWHKGTERVWLELATSGYAGLPHSTGMVFSEQRTALLAQRLSRVVLATEKESPSSKMTEEAVRNAAQLAIVGRPFVQRLILGSYEDAGAPSAAGIGWLCQDPALDFVIDQQALPTNIVQARDTNGKLWHLYRCEVFRPPSAAITNIERNLYIKP